MKPLIQLKNIWESDKGAFIQKEIGGLQAFVKDMLECAELFSLKHGNESTKIDKRKYEFTIETQKEGRRADFVIYINGADIVIPVEVEGHNNIQNGVQQLFQYQKDWKKKYGILTDGNQWRFYKSSQYRTFYIEDFFSNPKEFISYWQFYIKPENYYIELFNPSEQKELFNDKLDLNLQGNRAIFFDEVTQLIENFKGKMRAIGAFDNLFNQKENEKIAVETSYAYLIQFILYKVLVDNEYKVFKNEYDKMLLKIQKAIKDSDFYSIIINEIKNISEYISTNIYKPFELEQKSINRKLIENLKQDLTIDDIAPWLDIISFINRYNFAGLKNEIFGFIYENYLKDLYQDKNKGQYFTDPAVVDFMLDAIGYNKKKLKDRIEKNEISIIDPSCGAGTFLYSAVDRIIDAFDDGTESQSKFIENMVDKNIFGLDIEEFPLYLAEMNILMRMLPLIVNDRYENPIDNKLKIFKTKDSIAEFLDTGISSNPKDDDVDLFSHLEKTALDYPSFMRDEKDLEDMLKSMQEKSGKRERFDYVIGNPPYIGYNECCKQNIDFTIKIKDKEDNSISMNDVYGINLNTVQGRKKPYSPKPNLYAFFIALGLALLKKNGMLCLIIPQTILTAKDLDVIRFYLSKNTTIKEIIIFSGNLFIGRGLKQNKPIATSSLVFVAEMKEPEPQNQVKIINYHQYYDKNGIDFYKYFRSNNKDKKFISQKELCENITNWNFIKQNEKFLKSYKYYKKYSYSIDEYRRFQLSNYDEICIDGGLKLNKDLFTNKIIDNSFKIFNPKINDYKKYKLTKTNLYYSKNNEIEFIPGGQGMKAFKNKYKIIWKTRFNNIFQFSDIDDLILNGNQSLLISSNNKQEIYFLFSILNSDISLKVLSMFTQLPNESKYIVALSSIKELIRIPKITDKNQHIKEEIIKQTGYLLELEDLLLKDFIEFTTAKQKFSNIIIQDNDLILVDNEGLETKQRIKSKADFVKKLIERNYDGALCHKNEISLSEIKYIEAIDKKEQKQVKEYIDCLIFALYFDIDLKKIGFDYFKNIKNQCSTNEFYSLFYKTNNKEKD